LRRLKILVAEDHPLMIEAIDLALSGVDEFEIVGVAKSGRDVAPLCRRLQPDIVLLDLRMPGLDGMQVLDAIQQAEIETKVVVLSASEEPEVIERALRAGACAFITKKIDPHDLPAALHQALEQTLFQRAQINPLLGDNGQVGSDLTERELAVLTAVGEGLSNKEIAKRLSYAEQTVKLDLTHVYRKLGVSSRTAAMAVAYREGMIDSGLKESEPVD
jgi:DNA-binding NarL/FixJ family response regulator